MHDCGFPRKSEILNHNRKTNLYLETVLAVGIAVATMAGCSLPDEERPFVFVVEDDSGDEYMTLRALLNLAKTTEVVRDGASAVERLHILKSEGALPDVILLDLKLPMLNGFEVLKAVKADPILKDVAVVIFTSSDLESDQTKAEDMGAKQFVSKPVDYTEYRDSIRKAVNYALLRLT